MSVPPTQPPVAPSRRGIPLPLVRWRGFTTQMFLFIVLPLTVLLLVVVLGSLSLHHDSMRALVGDRDLRAVRTAAGSMTREIEHREEILYLFAAEIGGVRNTAAFLSENSLPEFEGGLALLLPDGRQISGSIHDLPDPGSHLPPSAAQPGVHFSGPIRSTSDAWWVLAVTPIPGGDLLVGAFSPQNLARSSLSGAASGQTTILLFSRDGQVLYQLGPYEHDELPILEHAGVQEVLRGETGVNYQPEDHSGHSHFPLSFDTASSEHVVAFSPVSPLGWGLVLEEPWEQNASPLLNLTQSAPLLLAPVLILAMLALWFGARQVIQPIQSLEVNAERLAAGDFRAIREPVGGISEVQHLQNALVNMAGALESAQEVLHSYIGALTAGVETERRSLARELHDDTLQALIALNQHVQMAVLRAPEAQRQPLIDLQSRVTATIANLRRAIGGLRPIYLEDLGLVAALGMLARDSENGPNTNSHPEVTFQVSGPEQRLSPEVELAFYRIAQEALNNAMHHAHAHRVEILLEFEPADPSMPTACLSITDDGRGFQVPSDPGAFAHLGHYGLLGMRERADLAGAQITIHSSPGEGTRVEVRNKLPSLPSPDLEAGNSLS